MTKDDFDNIVKIIGGFGLVGILVASSVMSPQHTQLRNQVPQAVKDCESGNYFKLGSNQQIAVSNYLVPLALVQYGEELGISAIADVNPELADDIRVQSNYLKTNQITSSDVSMKGHAFTKVDKVPECLETLVRYTGQQYN